MPKFLLLALLLACMGASAQISSSENKEATQLVVCISIEHFQPEYIDRYWNTFQNGGFKRLYTYGHRFENTRLDIHNIKPATVLASVFTGTYPAEHGVVADKWFKQLSQEEVDVVKNNNYLTLGSDSKEGNASALNMKVPTLGDAMKMQTNGKSKVFSVALNPTPAVITAGHSANGAYWFDKTNGNMISSSYYVKKFPDWVLNFNNKNLPAEYLAREWDLLLPLGSYTASFPDDNAYEKGFYEKWKTFPYLLKKVSEKEEFPLELLKASPWGNQLITDFATELIAREDLGQGDSPDLLSITYSSLDFANKSFSPYSIEMQDIYLRLDQNISAMLGYLDKVMGKDNYVLVLTSASTVNLRPDLLKEKYNMNAGEFSPQNAMALLRLFLNATYGVGDWIQMYNEEQIYLNHNFIENKEKDLNEMRNKVTWFMNQVAGIKAAIPANIIETGNLDNWRFKFLENSYCVQRSGDVMLLLEEGWHPTYRYHSVDYSTTNRFPLLFYGSKIKQGKTYDPADLIDVVPTISKLLGISPPDDAKGKILDKAFWENN